MHRRHNKRLKRDCQRVATLVQNCSSVFTVCFLSSAVRCQPLSRALCLQEVRIMKYTKNQHMLSQWFLRNFRSDDTANAPKDKQRVWCHSGFVA
ncbi:hypothetical protein DDN11_12970 [Vibrio cholerae]|nr:hypothetical protein [Vibrio cholerae]